MNENYKILVVDDELEICKIINKTLSDVGYNVDTAGSIEDANKYLSTNEPNLIILDKILPDGDGVEFTKEIFENPKLQSTYVLLMSGSKATLKDQLEGIEYGAVDFMIKPIRPDFLKSRVSFIIRVIEREAAKRIELEKINDKLKISEKRFNNLLENFPNGMITVYDKKYRFIYADGKGLAKLNLEKDKLIGHTITEVFPSKIVYKLMTFYDGVWRGNNVEFEYEMNNQNYFSAVAPIKNDEGVVYQILVITQNITEMRALQDKVKESEDRYRTFFENDLTADYLSTPEKGVVDCNQAFIDLLGYSSKDEILNLDPDELYPSRDFRKDFLQKLAKEKLIRNSEFEIITKEGNKRRVIENVIGVFNEHDELEQFYGYMYDITEIRKAQEALEESEEKYREIFENSALGIFRSTPEGKYEEVNQAFANILGFDSPKKMLSEVNDISKLYKNPRDREKIKEAFIRIGFVKDYEVLSNHSKNDIVWISINASAQLGSNGKVYYEGTIQDITEKKIALEKLKESENKYRVLAESAKHIILTHDLDGKIIYANKFAIDFMNLTKEQIIGENVTKFIRSQDDMDSLKLRQNDFLTGKKNVHHYELNIKLATGEDRILEAYGNPIIRNEEITSVMVVAYDITDRKQTEAELKESEEKLRNITNSVPGIIYQFVASKDGTLSFPYVSSRAKELLGFELDQFKDINFIFSIIHPEDYDFVMESVKRVTKEPLNWSLEFRVLTINDEVVWIKGQSTASVNEDGNIVHNGVFLDITEKKLAEQLLNESREEIDRILDNSMDGILLTAPDGSIYSANSAACDMFGRTEEEICRVGRDGVVDLEDPRLKEFLETRKKKDKARAEVNLLKKDGSKFPAEVSSALFKDTDGNIRSSMIVRDVTERKLAEEELRKSKEFLAQTGEMAKVGGWEYFTETNELYWSDVTKQIHEVSLDYKPSLENGLNFFHSASKKLLQVALNKANETGKGYDLELELTTAKGNDIWIRTIGFTEFSDGKCKRIYGVVQDITSIKKSEIALKESEEKLKQSEAFLSTLLESISVPLFYKDLEGKYKGVNSALEDFLGRKREDLIDKTLFDITPVELARTYYEKDKELLDEGGTQKYETEIVVKNGDRRNVIFNKAVYRDSAGNIDGLIGTISDVTEERKAEKALKESEEKYRNLFENMVDEVHLWKIIRGENEKIINWELVDANHKALKYWGKTKKQVVGKTVDEIFNSDAIDQFMPIVEEIFNSGKSKRWESYFSKTDQYLSMESVAFGNYFISTGRDITDKIKAEKAQKETDQRLGNVMLNSSNMFYQHGIDQKLSFVSPQVQDILGYTPEETMKEWTNFASDNPINKEGYEKTLQAIKTGEPQGTYNLELVHKNGKKVWVEVREVPIKENGKVTSIIGSLLDITERKKAEDALKESEEKLRAFFDSDVIGTIYGDIYGGIHQTNDRCLEIIGYGREDIEQGKVKWDKITPPEFYDLERAKVEEAKKNGMCTPYEKQYIRKDGSKVWVIVGYVLVGEKREDSVAFILDINDRKKVEEELKESEAFLQAALDNSHAGIAIADVPDGKLRYVNKAGLMIRGKDADEIVKNIDINKYVSSWKLMHLDGTEYLPNRVPLARAVLYGETVREEFIVGRENEEDRYVLAHAAPINNESGKRIAAIVVFLDITEQKLAEKQLLESEERTRLIFDNSLTGILLADKNGNILEANPSLVNMLGSPSAEATKKINIIKFEPLKKLGFSQKFKEAVNKNIITGGEDWYVSKWGKKLIINYSFIPVERNRKVYRVISTIDNVTKLREAEQALIDSEEKYKTLVESAPDAIAIHIDGKLVFVNSAAVKLLQAKNKEQLIGMNINKIVHPEILEEVKSRVISILKGEKHFYTIEEKYVTIKGKDIDVEVTATRINFENQKALQVIIRDVSERKRAQEQIVKERNMAEKYLESADIMMLVLDKNGKITMINSKGAKILGYSKKYIIGKNWFDYFIPDEEVKNVKRFFKKAVSGELISLEYYQNRVKCRYNKIRTVGWYNNFIKDENGLVKEVISSGEDITETIALQKELETSHAELKRLTAYLQKIREEERSNLARELHDDLGQSLTALKLDISQISKNIDPEQVKLNKKVQSAYTLVSDTIKTVQKITSELRPGMIDDLGLVSTLEWYVDEYKERTNIKINLNVKINESDIPDEHKISIYRIIQEALTNVARHSNATRVSIKFEKQGKDIIIVIKDSGRGITEEQINKLDSFGMMGMKERTVIAGGQFKISGEKNKGTKISVSLPING